VLFGLGVILTVLGLLVFGKIVLVIGVVCLVVGLVSGGLWYRGPIEGRRRYPW